MVLIDKLRTECLYRKLRTGIAVMICLFISLAAMRESGAQAKVSPEEMFDRLHQMRVVIEHFIMRCESLQRQQQVLLEELRTQLGEIEQLQMELANLIQQTRVPDATQFEPPPMESDSEAAFLDRLKNTIQLPELREERPLLNGDFEAGLDGWEKGYATDRMDSVRTCEVLYDEDAQSNVVEFRRTGGGADGSSVGLYQDVFIDLARYEDVRLKLDVKPIFQSLTGGGWAGGAEYPVTVQIAFIDQRGDPHLWSHGFYYEDVSRYEDATKVEQDAWFTYTSPNLKEIMPDCADEVRTSDGIAWGKTIPEYEPPVIPMYITRILILGSGWDFEGRADNIELLMTPREE